ncbi:MAG: o-succinylbenzoate synthase [Actinobacteria bacterium]|nr:o-succinylbenzoate synthase [Actinomycetota bacterium]
MLDSILESLRVVNLPTKTDFRSITHREVALFSGAAGWGEFAPFLEYGPRESIPWLVSAIESACVPAPIAKHEWIRVNATLPAVNGQEKVAEILSWFPGCDTIKIKVGANLQEDLVRISHAKSARPSARIRLDVNGNWSVDQAVTALRATYENFGEIEYVEQPCATLDELRELKKKIGFPFLIAGDEVIRKSADPFALDLRGAVDVVMLKVAPLGGIRRAREIADHHGLPSVVSSALDSAVGISTGLRLAASFDSQTFSAGLATGQLLAGDVAEFPLVDGRIQVAQVMPTLEALAKYEATPDRYTFWRERVMQTWDAGARDQVAREEWIA